MNKWFDDWFKGLWLAVFVIGVQLIFPVLSLIINGDTPTVDNDPSLWIWRYSVLIMLGMIYFKKGE